MLSFTEDTFEQAIIELFENMGYTHIYAPDMNRCLAQEGRALGKLRVKLIVKINAIGHYNNGRTVQSLL